MNRDKIMCRLRIRDQQERAPLPEGFPEFPRTDDPVAEFRRQLGMVGAHFIDGRVAADLERGFGRILAETGAERLIWEGIQVLRRHSIPFEWRVESPQGSGILQSQHTRGEFSTPVTLEPGPSARHDLERELVSVSSAVWAIAETGTLVESTAIAGSRLLPIIAPVHVCLLSERKILHNHRDFFADKAADLSASARVLMTGPSRTADIEKTLVIGVHGPKTLYIILTR